MKVLNKICQFVYEIAIVGSLLLAILASVHGHFTQHFSVVQTIDSSHVAITGDFSNIAIGDKVNLYRFNYDWKPKLGDAEIVSKSENQAIVSFDPQKMAWPMGLNGQITQNGDIFYVSIGSNLGLKKGDILNIFADRNYLGRVHVVEAGVERSSISKARFLTENKLESLVASNFVIPNQATYFQNKTLSGVEILLTLGIFFLYSIIYFFAKKSPLILFGQLLKKIPIPKTLIFWLINILAALPFVWFMSKMPLHLFAYLWKIILEENITSGFIPTLTPIFYIAIGLGYFYFLFKTHKSPILAFWHFISYKKPAKNSSQQKSFSKRLLLWCLYLVIIYAFASTLTSFLTADLAAMKAIDLNNNSREATFEFLKYGIWALTIVGCLLGYSHSVVSFLWGKYVRNIDFTVQGWLTNGFCYPLFGVVIWQMIPSFTGVDPIITDGPLQLLMLYMGLLLNVLYMLSIWNLGTMFGLMADKGVRTWGFYSVVRHPSYTLEVLMFFITELMGLTMGIQWLAISMYFFLYWIRSEREDNFMKYSNPEFTPYAEETPYKFIPGIY